MNKKILLIGAMLGLIITPAVSIAATTNKPTLTKIPKIGQWHDAPGAMISNGAYGTIFQAGNGDLYAMGKGSGLDVLKKGASNFESAPGTSITNGDDGVIFETSAGDLYAMGNESGLEVLKRGTTHFKSAPGTNINDGYGGTIFEARSGDLYAMGYKSGLEVLKKGEATEFQKVIGTNIKDGAFGRIFETSNGDLYAMGKGSGLDVLKKGASNFESAPGTSITNGDDGVIFETSTGDLYAMGNESGLEVLKRGATHFKLALGTMITNGFDGVIFEASNGDLYAMGYKSGLEVLKRGATHFKSAPGTNINDGYGGTIFEASNGDLYAMGFNTRLEVLKRGTTHFKSAPGTMINDGWSGTIFEASNGDLYAMGSGSKLEVLKKEKKEFEKAVGTRITDGYSGSIFEASNGDLYAMGEDSKLQVLENNRLEFEWHDEATKGQGDGSIEIKNYTNKYSKLQYKLSSLSTWTNVPPSGEIQNLITGTYHFRWVSKKGEHYVGGTDTSISLTHEIVIRTRIPYPWGSSQVRTITHITSKDANDGTITSKDVEYRHSKLQYKLSSATTWIDVPHDGRIINLIPGTYEFQYVGKHNEYYEGGEVRAMGLAEHVIKDSAEILPPLQRPNFASSDETTAGASDGTITVTSFDDHYSKVQYKLSSALAWTEMPHDGQIQGLAPGTYNFRWVGKKDEQYVGGLGTSIAINYKIVIATKITPPLLAPDFAIQSETIKGTNDGAIIVTNFDDPYSKVQYKLSSTPAWTEMPHGGQIQRLAPGTYSFRWVSKNNEQYVGGASTSIPLSDQTISDGLKIPLASTPNFAIKNETIKGTNDGGITVTNFDDPYSKVQYKLSSAPAWTEMPHGGQIQHLAPGTYNFRWVGESNEQYAGGDSISIPLNDQTISDGLKIPLASTPNFAIKNETIKGANDGGIIVTNFDDPYSKVQYKLSSTPAWTEMPHGGQIQRLAPGTYSFRWVSKNNEQYVGGASTSIPLSDQTISDGLKIPLASTPNFAIKNETIKGTNDGSITVTNFDDPYSKVQYKLNSAPAWTEMPHGGQIQHLAPGTYNFRWVGESNEQYAGGDSISIPLNDQTISDGLKIPLASTPNFAIKNETIKGANDGTITVTSFNNPYSKLQYKLSSASTWIDVPTINGKITNLTPGTYNFWWVGENNEQYVGGASTSIPLSDQTISDGLKIPVASTPNFVSTHTTIKGANDGTITVTSFNNPYSKLQYKLSSTPKWANVPSSGKINHLVLGTYNFQWVGKNGEAYPDGKFAINLQNQIIEIFNVFKTPSMRLKKILAIAIPTSLIGLIIPIWLIKHFISENQKMKTKK